MSAADAVAIQRHKRRRRRPPTPEELLPVIVLAWCIVWFVFNAVAIVFASETVIFAAGMAIQGAGVVYWWPRAWPALKRWIIGEEG